MLYYAQQRQKYASQNIYILKGHTVHCSQCEDKAQQLHCNSFGSQPSQPCNLVLRSTSLTIMPAHAIKHSCIAEAMPVKTEQLYYEIKRKSIFTVCSVHEASKLQFFSSITSVSIYAIAPANCAATICYQRPLLLAAQLLFHPLVRCTQQIHRNFNNTEAMIHIWRDVQNHATEVLLPTPQAQHIINIHVKAQRSQLVFNAQLSGAVLYKSNMLGTGWFIDATKLALLTSHAEVCNTEM